MKPKARLEQLARRERCRPLSVPLLLLAAIGAASAACGGVSDGAVQPVPPPPVQPVASPSPDASSGGTTVDGGTVDGGGGGGITCAAVDAGTAVDAGGGDGITCTEPGTPVSGPPIVPGTLNHMTLTGHAIDETCAPVANATIRLEYRTSTTGGTPFPYVDVITDATGAYTVKFDAVPYGNGLLAWASAVFSSTYENDFRYVKVATQQATVNFHFRHREIVTVGATTAVKLSSADPVCHNNVQDMNSIAGWPDIWTCHTLRLQAPSTGTLTVQMVETDTPSSSTQLLVEAPEAVRYFSKTTSLPVSAGQWVLINPELIVGGPAQWVNITTALCGVSP